MFIKLCLSSIDCLHMNCYFLGVNTVNVPINRNHVYKWTLFEMTLTPGTAVCASLYPSAFIELK